MDYQEILKQFSLLDLSSYPVNNVIELIRALGKFGVAQTNLHPGYKILRGRINYDNEVHDSISKLSYKPQEYNKTYMRASTPLQTMFYGSIISEVRHENEVESARIPIAYELSTLLRDSETEGELKITYTSWEVKEDIHLFSLIHHNEYKKPPQLIINLREQFENFISSHPEEKEKTLAIVKFLSQEFAKSHINGDYDYLISAIYSEMITSHFDGVLYPSVRLGGEAINIAVKPNLIDNKKIVLKAAGECTIYKKGKNVLIGNDRMGIIHNDDSITYEKAPKDVFVSREQGRKHVGLD